MCELFYRRLNMAEAEELSYVLDDIFSTLNITGNIYFERPWPAILLYLSRLKSKIYTLIRFFNLWN